MEMTDFDPDPDPDERTDYQKHVERELRYDGQVAVASTANNETTYIWYDGDEYRGMIRRFTKGFGYSTERRNTFPKDKRLSIFRRNNVASVPIRELPDGEIKRTASREIPNEKQ
jgi:hypothetical protein